ncbi:MAG: hypothetical protein QOG51_779 [Verrucomicrobiota bacterium]
MGEFATKAFNGEWRGSEIQEQAILELSCLQIATANCEMDVFQGADCLQLYDDLILDQEIQAMFADLVILVEKRNWFLSNELNSTKCEFDGQRLLIYGLEKSRTKFAVNPNGRGDYALGRFGIS